MNSKLLNTVVACQFRFSPSPFTRTKRHISLALLGVLVFAGWGYAVVYTVDNSLPPSGKRYASMTALLVAETLKGGDTVNVIGTGTPYSEFVHIEDNGNEPANPSWKDDSGTSSSSRLVFQGVNNPIIDGTGVTISTVANTNVGLVELSDTQYVTFRGFQVHNSERAGITVREEDWGAQTKGIIIEDCEVKNTRTNGIVAAGQNINSAAGPSGSSQHQPDDVIIRNNKIEHACDGINSVSPSGGEALTILNCTNFEVYGNEIWDNQKEGIDIVNGSNNGDVYQNLVRDRGQSGYPNFRGAGIYVDGSHNGVFNVNVFRNVVVNQAVGMTVASESGGDVIGINFYNNLVYDSWTNTFVLSGNGGESTPPGLQKNVHVYHNTFVGPPATGNNPTPPANSQYVILLQDENNPASNMAGFWFYHNIVSRKDNGSARFLFLNDHGFNIPSLYVHHNLYFNHGAAESGFHGLDFMTLDPVWSIRNVWVGGRWWFVPYGIHFQTSPAKDAAPFVGVPVDIHGHSRPVGPKADYGAFEPSS